MFRHLDMLKDFQYVYSALFGPVVSVAFRPLTTSDCPPLSSPLSPLPCRCLLLCRKQEERAKRQEALTQKLFEGLLPIFQMMQPRSHVTFALVRQKKRLEQTRGV